MDKRLKGASLLKKILNSFEIRSKRCSTFSSSSLLFSLVVALTTLTFLTRPPLDSVNFTYDEIVTKPIPFYTCHPSFIERAKSSPGLQVHLELCSSSQLNFTTNMNRMRMSNVVLRPHVPLALDSVFLPSPFHSTTQCTYTFVSQMVAVSGATLVYEPRWKRAVRLPQLQNSDWIIRISMSVETRYYRSIMWCVFPDGTRVNLVYIPSVTGICEVPYKTKIFLDQHYPSPESIPILISGPFKKKTDAISICVTAERQRDEVSVKGHPFKFMAITMMHRSQHRLREWLTYHLILGFPHFLIYHDLHEGDDQLDWTFYALKPYIQQGLVSYVSFEQYSQFNERQFLSLAHFQNHFSNMSEWIIELDDDMYVVPMNGHDKPVKSVVPLLDRWKSEEEVRFYWNLFGSSEQLEPPDYMTLGYFWRSNSSAMTFNRSIDNTELYAFQSFTKTSALLYPFSTHNWTRRALEPQLNELFSGSFDFNTSLPKPSVKPPLLVPKHEMVLSHYYVRSFEEWLLRNETAWSTPLINQQRSFQDAQRLWNLANRGFNEVFDDRMIFYKDSLLECIDNLTKLREYLDK